MTAAVQLAVYINFNQLLNEINSLLIISTFKKSV